MMMAYIGGTGTIVGPIIGAVFFVILREFLVLKLAEMHLMVFAVLFIRFIGNCRDSRHMWRFPQPNSR